MNKTPYEFTKCPGCGANVSIPKDIWNDAMKYRNRLNKESARKAMLRKKDPLYSQNSFNEKIKTLIKKGRVVDAAQELFYERYAGDVTKFMGEHNPGLFSHDMLHIRNDVDEEILFFADWKKWMSIETHRAVTGAIRNDAEYTPSIITDNIWKNVIDTLINAGRINFFRIESGMGWVKVSPAEIDYFGRNVLLARDQTSKRIDRQIAHQKKII